MYLQFGRVCVKIKTVYISFVLGKTNNNYAF